MVKVKAYRGYFLLGYWKRRLIGVPIPFAPGSDQARDYFELIEMPDNISILDIIDPKEMSPVTIREICEKNDFPFGWVTGMNPLQAGFELVLNEDDFLDKAIFYFIALRASSTTASQYRRQFSRLRGVGIIKNGSTICKYLINLMDIERDVFQLSEDNTNMQIYHMLQAFHAFLKDPKHVKRRKKPMNYEHTRREDRLQEEEADQFFAALKKVNPTHELFGRILYYLNQMFKGDSDEGPIIEVETLLRLKKDDLQGENGHSVINFVTRKGLEPTFFSTYIPEELFARLLPLAAKSLLYVFHNKHQGPIDSGQIRRAFVRASKLAGLSRKISPAHLR